METTTTKNKYALSGWFGRCVGNERHVSYFLSQLTVYYPTAVQWMYIIDNASFHYVKLYKQYRTEMLVYTHFNNTKPTNMK